VASAVVRQPLTAAATWRMMLRAWASPGEWPGGSDEALELTVPLPNVVSTQTRHLVKGHR